MFSFSTMRMNVKRRLYEGVAVFSALNGAEIWSMAVAEKKRLNLMKMRCLRNVCRVTCTDKVRNEELQRRTSVMRVV